MKLNDIFNHFIDMLTEELKILSTTNIEYEAGEEAVMYYSDMSGYPGSRGSYYPHTIYAEDSDIDIVELFSPADLKVLAEKILDKLED